MDSPCRAIVVLTALWLSVTADAAEHGAAAEVPDGVDAFLSKYDRPDSPGCVVGIIRDGRLIYSKAIGAANLDHEVPLTPETVFDVGSVAKSFTSACVALLLDEGRISPSDDIRRYVPELHAFDPPVQIRHLIRCRSGIWAQWHIKQLAGWSSEPIESPYSQNDLLTLLSGQKTLPFEPGSEFRYGTSDYFLLGIIVQRVTGQTLGEFAEENLFEPLGMTSTFIMQDPTRVVKHRATGYYKGREGQWRKWETASSAPGGCGLHTTLDDLCCWDRNFSENRLPSGKHIDEFITRGTLLENRNVLNADPVESYRGLQRIQFTGGMPGFEAAITRFPDQRFTVICLSNNSEISPMQVNVRIADLCLADELGPASLPDINAEGSANDQVTTADPDELRDKIGAYRLRSDERIWQIVLQNGKLSVIDHLGLPHLLTPMGRNRFRPEGGFFEASARFVFERESPESPFSLTSRWTGGSIVLERVTLVTPDAKELHDFVGRYESDELVTTYRFESTKGSCICESTTVAGSRSMRRFGMNSCRPSARAMTIVSSGSSVMIRTK